MTREPEKQSTTSAHIPHLVHSQATHPAKWAELISVFAPDCEQSTQKLCELCESKLDEKFIIFATFFPGTLNLATSRTAYLLQTEKVFCVNSFYMNQ